MLRTGIGVWVWQGVTHVLLFHMWMGIWGHGTLSTLNIALTLIPRRMFSCPPRAMLPFVLQSQYTQKTHSQTSFTFFYLIQFSLESSWFTMLCQFLLYSKVNQLYIYLLFFIFCSHIGHYRVLEGAPCTIQQVLIAIVCHGGQNVLLTISYVSCLLLVLSSAKTDIAFFAQKPCLARQS